MRGGLCIDVYSDAGNWNNVHTPGLLSDWLTVALPEGDMRFSPGYGRTVGTAYYSERIWFPLHLVMLQKQLAGGPRHRWVLPRSSNQIDELGNAVMCITADPCKLSCTIDNRCYSACLEFRERCFAPQVERIDEACTSKIQKMERCT